jgi:hypothetical protein
MDFIQDIAERLVNDYFSSKEDPNANLVKLAQGKGLSAHQIQRIANKANRKIIVELHKNAAKSSIDPHFIFPMVKVSEVLAVLKTPPDEAMAAPSLPPKVISMGAMDRVFPPAPLAEKPPTIDEMCNRMVFRFPDQNTATMVLSILKQKAGDAKTKAEALEMALDKAISEVEKTAQRYLMEGHPVDPLEALGLAEVLEPTVEKLASMKYNIYRLDEPFELNESHPLVKMASDLREMEVKVAQGWAEAYEAERKYQTAKGAAKVQGVY